MTNLINLVGNYQLQNKVLINSSIKLLIANRSNTSSTKTPLFLVNKSLPSGGYISSLYPLAENNSYKFDYAGRNYKLVLLEDSATINLMF